MTLSNEEKHALNQIASVLRLDDPHLADLESAPSRHWVARLRHRPLRLISATSLLLIGLAGLVLGILAGHTIGILSVAAAEVALAVALRTLVPRVVPPIVLAAIRRYR